MARGINKVILIGNLGRDPDVRYTPSGSAVTNLAIATDDSYKDKQTGQMVPRTDWHRVVLFGKVAEIAGQYLKKGAKVYIEGKLKTRKWTNKEGVDVFTTEIVVDIEGTMQMLDSIGQGAQGTHGAAQQTNNQPPAQRGGQGQQHAGGDQGSYPTGNNMPEPIDDFDDDIPF